VGARPPPERLLRPTPYYATPLSGDREGEGPPPPPPPIRRASRFRVLFSPASRRGIPATRALIEKTFGGAAWGHGEHWPRSSQWMTNGECGTAPDAPIGRDLVYTQICDPGLSGPCPTGPRHARVTHLERTSQPRSDWARADRARWVATRVLRAAPTSDLARRGYLRPFETDHRAGVDENIYREPSRMTCAAIEGFGGELG